MQDKEILEKSSEESTSTVSNGGKSGNLKEREDSFEEIGKKEQTTKDGKFAFRKMKQSKKEKSDKKSNGTAKFGGDGVSFKAKLIGVEEVSNARGDKMCQDSMFRLKLNVKNQGPHKRKINISVSLDGIKIRDEKSGDNIYHHPVPRISFISQDITDARAFGYVASSLDGQHEFIAIKTEKPAFHVVLALRDLFQTVLNLKQEKMEQVKEKQGENQDGQDTDSGVGSDSLKEKSSVHEESSESASKTEEEKCVKDENIYFDVIVSEPFQEKGSSDTAWASLEEKETKSVDDLLCLQDELNKLQQGIAQMDTSIAAVSDTLGVKDPFDTSFLTPGASKIDTFPLPMPAPVPVTRTPPSPTSTRASQAAYEDKYAPLAEFDAQPSIFESALNKEEQQKFADVPDLNDLEEEIKKKSGVPIKPPRGSKSPAPDTSVFADLDPLGKDRPYVDKTEFFQELKNPPKKVLNDLLDKNGSDDFVNRAFDSGIGSPVQLPLSPVELASQHKQSLASSLPNSFLSNMKFSAFNGTTNPFNPFEDDPSALPNATIPNNQQFPFGSKRDSLGSSQDSECSSPIPIPSRTQELFGQRERAMSNGTSTPYSQSPCPLDSSRSSSQADIAGTSPVRLKLTNGFANHDHTKSKSSLSSSELSLNGTNDGSSTVSMTNGKSKQSNSQNSVSRPRPRPQLSKGSSLPNGGVINLNPVSNHASTEYDSISKQQMQSIANMLRTNVRRTRAASLPVETNGTNGRIPYPAEKNIFAKKSDPFGDEFFSSLPKKIPAHISATQIQEYA